MFFNVALFKSLLLVPAVVALPSGLGPHIAHRREGHQSHVSNHLEQNSSAVSNTVYTTNWAGAVWAEGDVCNIHDLQSHLISCSSCFNRELSHMSLGRLPSPPLRVRRGVPPLPGLVSMGTHVQVLFSRPVSHSPSKAVNLNTMVRRHPTMYSCLSHHSFHQQPGTSGTPPLPTISLTSPSLPEMSSNSLSSPPPPPLALQRSRT